MSNRKIPFMAYLTPKQMERLDDANLVSGLDRTEIIRRALDAYLMEEVSHD